MSTQTESSTHEIALKIDAVLQAGQASLSLLSHVKESVNRAIDEATQSFEECEVKHTDSVDHSPLSSLSTPLTDQSHSLSKDMSARVEMVERLLSLLDDLVVSFRDNGAIKSSPDSFSIPDINTVVTASEILACFGLRPAHIRALHATLTERSRAMSTVGSAPFWEVCQKGGLGWSPAQCDEWLSRLTAPLVSLLTRSFVDAGLRTRLMQSILTDLLASIMQVAYRPTEVKDPNTKAVSKPDEKRRLIKHIDKLLSMATPTQALHSLTTIMSARDVPVPDWLSRQCILRLSKCVLRSQGVNALFEQVFSADDVSDEKEALSVINHAARLVSLRPKHIPVNEFYSRVCPQVAALIIQHSRDSTGDHLSNSVVARANIWRACVLSAWMLYQRHPKLAGEYLVDRMIRPFGEFVSKRLSPSKHKNTEKLRIIAQEEDIDRSLECIDKFVMTCSSMGLTPVRIISNKPCILDRLAVVFPAIFRLFCFAQKNSSNRLVSLTENVLMSFLKACPDPVSVIKSLIMSEFSCNPAPSFVEYTPGSTDGAMLVHTCSAVDSDRTKSIDFLLEFLQSDPGSPLASDLFASLLADIEGASNDDGMTMVTFIGLLGDRMGSSVLRDVSRVTQFLKVMMEKSSDETTLQLCLTILSTLLSGNLRISDTDQSHLDGLIPVLERTRATGDSDLSDAAHALQIRITAIAVQKKFANENENQRSFESKEEKDQTFAQALRGLESPLPAMRAQSVMRLHDLLLTGNSDARAHISGVFAAMARALHDSDAYVWEAAVRALSACVARWPEEGVRRVVRKLQTATLGEQTRLKLAEVLIRTAEALGDKLEDYLDILVDTFIKIASDRSSSLRASGLSGLASLCGVGGSKIEGRIEDVVGCLLGVLRRETDSEVKRAAYYLVGHIFKTLGVYTLSKIPLAIDELRESLVNALQTNTEDENTRAQASLAMDELERVLRALRDGEIN
eukprot:374440_1